MLAHTQTACKNGAWCLKQASQDLSILDITQDRDEKLFRTDYTFNTVHEAVLYLRICSIQSKGKSYLGRKHSSIHPKPSPTTCTKYTKFPVNYAKM